LGARSDQRDDTVAYVRVLAAMETLRRRDRVAVQHTATRDEKLAATSERVLIIAMVGAVLLALVGARRLTAALLKPIKALPSSAMALGEGDRDRTAPEFTGDELGQLTRLHRERSRWWDSGRKCRTGV